MRSKVYDKEGNAFSSSTFTVVAAPLVRLPLVPPPRPPPRPRSLPRPRSPPRPRPPRIGRSKRASISIKTFSFFSARTLVEVLDCKLSVLHGSRHIKNSSYLADIVGLLVFVLLVFSDIVPNVVCTFIGFSDALQLGNRRCCILLQLGEVLLVGDGVIFFLKFAFPWFAAIVTLLTFNSRRVITLDGWSPPVVIRLRRRRNRPGVACRRCAPVIG